MRIIDTDALGAVARALGVGNPATATEPVSFDDGVLQQVLEVSALVRRARTPAGSSGVFACQVTNEHAAAGSLQTEIDPYAVDGSTAGWPSPIPTGFDVWLLSVQGAAAANVMNTARGQRWEIKHPQAAAAFGASGTITQLVALYDSTVPIGDGGVVYFGRAGDGVTTYEGPAIRIPRGAKLVWGTTALDPGGDMIGQAVLGLFPAGLGQDGRA